MHTCTAHSHVQGTAKHTATYAHTQPHTHARTQPCTHARTHASAQVSEASWTSFGVNVSADMVILSYSTALFDAIMLYAHAATKVLLNGGQLYNGPAMAHAVRNTTIESVAKGIVALDKNGDRISSYEVMNYVVEADDQMNSVPVGTYDSSEQQYTAYERAVVWPGSTIEVPVDYFSGTPTNAR